MGRPKGGKNRSWTQADRLRIVSRYNVEGIGINSLAKDEGISRGLLSRWISRYQSEGKNGLINKRKIGNPYAALHTSKSLTEEQKLRLIIAQQEIEIERLKKGYLVKGDGLNKEFVTTKDVSLK